MTTDPDSRTQRPWANWSRRKKILAIGIGAAIAVVLLGSLTESDTTADADSVQTVTVIETTAVASASSSDPEEAPTPSPQAYARVPGALTRDCTISCSSDEAAATLEARDIYCYWDDTSVKVDLTLTNRMNAHVTYSITPKYEIERGGTHGTSFGSDEEIGIDAQASRTVTIDAGAPEGVSAGARISSCSPNLLDADIG